MVEVAAPVVIVISSLRRKCVVVCGCLGETGPERTFTLSPK